MTFDLRHSERHPDANLSDALLGLHRAGWLEGAYLVLASLYNMRRLIAEKQRRLREEAGQGQAA